MESSGLPLQEDVEDLETYEEVADFDDDDQSWTSVSSEDSSLSEASTVCSLTEKSSIQGYGDLTRLKSFSLLKDAVVNTQARLARVAANLLDPTSVDSSSHEQATCAKSLEEDCTDCDIDWQVSSAFLSACDGKLASTHVASSCFMRRPHG